MGRFFRRAWMVGVFGLSACTYNIQPIAPTVQVASGATKLNCQVLLLLPQEFTTREYVSSFEGREVRFLIGPPVSEAIESLLRSRFVGVQKQNATGDGTLEFVRMSMQQKDAQNLIARPRFVRLDSSVRPFRYSMEFGVALDIGGAGQPMTAQGQGTGTAGAYTQTEIQNAANDALSQLVAKLATSLPANCN
jgi:hypothetical protein